jgi:5-methylcytosine-specific restriction endonuclease McrA
MPHRIPTYRPLGLTRHQEYDRFGRDQASKRFYNSTAWQKARLMQLHEHPLCWICEQLGLAVPATHVHHIVELTDAPGLALDPSNHRSLCHACHSKLHASTSPTPDANACTSREG